MLKIRYFIKNHPRVAVVLLFGIAIFLGVNLGKALTSDILIVQGIAIIIGISIAVICAVFQIRDIIREVRCIRLAKKDNQ